MNTMQFHFLAKQLKCVSFLLNLVYCLFNSSLGLAADTPKFTVYTDNGSGTPLVLIHAFPTDQRLWKPQQEELKKHFRVITLDLYGFGNSSTTDGQAVTMTDYADEVHHLLQKLHVHKAIMGGESMGGYIALAFLKKYPDNVSGLILSNTQSIADSTEVKIKRETTAVDILNHGTKELINGFLLKALSPQTSEQTRDYLKTILDAQKASGMASALRGMSLRDDTSNVLANTTLPVLIITSDQDAVIPPQQSETMHQLAKNSKLVTISDAGHLSNLEQPKQWNQPVIEMFDKK